MRKLLSTIVLVAIAIVTMAQGDSIIDINEVLKNNHEPLLIKEAVPYMVHVREITLPNNMVRRIETKENIKISDFIYSLTKGDYFDFPKSALEEGVFGSITVEFITTTAAAQCKVIECEFYQYQKDENDTTRFTKEILQIKDYKNNKACQDLMEEIVRVVNMSHLFFKWEYAEINEQKVTSLHRKRITINNPRILL